MQNSSTSVSMSKRIMRSIWRSLPRTGLTYNIGKLLTRTALKPESTPHRAQVKFAGTHTMHLDLSDIVCNDIFCMDDHYEAPTLALWRSLAKDANTILDLGSHVGVFACAAAAANPRANIIAVEAFERNAAMLRENAAPFPNLIPVQIAIGLTKGKKTFRVSPITGGGYIDDEEAPGLATPGTRDQSGASFELETVTLAELCTQHDLKSVDLMKMDLEGLEHALMTGQEGFWSGFSPTHVIVEITLGKKQLGIQREIFDAMTRRGYGSRRVEGLYAIPWLQEEDLANWHFWKVESH